ncbi:MAG: ATP-binding cassette domain-containing protein [Anaerolineae bacterium]|nr:ATP-binding cassette domain-containing protein [Anaerolineae bacterium]
MLHIKIEGANEHNLQDVDIEFGEGLTVVTGVSGSGKTSLVFDTLYHEARRRFLEIFALGSSELRLAPARVRSITGLGPAVAVGQNLLNRNPNSTLATASGLHPFLRLLYARFGQRRCPRCGASLEVLSEDEIVERLIAMSRAGGVDVLAPLVQRVYGSHRTLLQILAEQFHPEELLVDGAPWDGQHLSTDDPHDLAVRVAHLGAGSQAAQVRQVIEMAGSLGAQAVMARPTDGGPVQEALTLSRAPVCVVCGAWFDALEPTHFHLPCPHCSGQGCAACDRTGLHPQAAATYWQGLRLPDLLALSATEGRSLFSQAELPVSAARLQSEILRRLEALEAVGLGYIGLERPSPSLSRGEAQRVRLAIALVSQLEDMLHVLDEPTIGQHPHDVARLLPVLRRLGGPVIYVEHDRLAAAEADRAIDLGPGAGQAGGRVIFEGAPAALWKASTPTGRYFSLRERVQLPEGRPAPHAFLVVRGASEHNLRGIDVPFPLGRLSVITGISGSGKSTLVQDVLAASLSAEEAQGCDRIEGPALRAVMVTQDPIGRNPRSNPATYTKLSDIIRDLYASVTGLSSSHFSFNRPEGACPTCEGLGATEVRMRYLPSTWIPCADCDGQRFSEEVLAAQVPFGEWMLSIADFYRLSIAEASRLLARERRLPPKARRAARRILRALSDIGLGYLTLGQPSPTLSGGEAQRVKLAKYLGRRSLARDLIVLDEPSTGLHPQDVAGLLQVLDRLVRGGATVVVVEHNTDIMRAADWIIDLGPGAGPHGGELLYAGPPEGLLEVGASHTAQALHEEAALEPRAEPEALGRSRSRHIAIRGASAHNLQDVDVDIPKGRLTVVTGVSGSGKSSLVSDVLEAEARRRFLESLSMYERQGAREGPEASVESVAGLGVAVTVEAGRRRHFDRRATVGTATEIAHHLAVLMASLGERPCLACGAAMVRRRTPESAGREIWLCPACGASAPLAEPRHFSPSNYAAACLTCHGVGSLRKPNADKLIVHPERPLCDGAMYSPGFFPQGYLCKPYNGGYDMVQALAGRYGFDPASTPWREMSAEARQAFLYGDPEPIEVVYRSRKGRVRTSTQHFPGFYGWIRDWDVGGTYTDSQVCPTCGGGRLRPEYAAVTLAGHNMQALGEAPLWQLAEVMGHLELPAPSSPWVAASLRTIRLRLRFLGQVGLGYLHLHRESATLSAGEAQRIKLAALLGSGLTSLTILLDEPTRGLHPSEVEALVGALAALRDEGNTVIVVEHDPVLIRAADYLLDLGPGAGAAGGRIIAQGTPEQVMTADTPTAAWLRGERRIAPRTARRQPKGWMTIVGARENNLKGEEVRIPLGALVGVCGVSGSGKSTLLVDTLARALAPRKQTTSVAYEPIEPGAHEAILGAPRRAITVDQTRAGLHSPASFLNLERPLWALYAESEDAQALGLSEKDLSSRCSVCRGEGAVSLDMGFLPAVHIPCETCAGTGYRAEAWQVRLQGVALPELMGMTIDQVYALFAEDDRLSVPLQAARDVGLGYLVLRQPGYALSGGEAQRLKIAKELCRRTTPQTLYILDEPTLGQHLEDAARLSGVLHRLVDAGHTVLIIEHHAHLLASCDWLIELGPRGGPEGGHIIAAGRPESLAAGQTPTAPYLREILGAVP